MKNSARTGAEEDPAVFAAMKDSLVADERTLDEVLDLGLTKRLIRGVRCRLDLHQLVTRIQYSFHADELLPFVLQIQGISSSEEMLSAAHLVRDGIEAFGKSSIEAFAGEFWLRRVLEQADAGNVQQAWRLLKIAVLGEDALQDRSCHDYVLPGQVEGEPIGLVTDISGANRLVRELYAHLQDRNLVGDLLKEQETVGWNRELSVPGLPLARHLGGATCSRGHSKLTAVGVMVVTIGRAVHSFERCAAADNHLPRSDLAVA